MKDYHDFTTKDMPKGSRQRLGVGDIWVNAVKCLKCGDVPRSKNRHHCCWCKCGDVAVDGGSFITRVTGDPRTWESMVEFFSDAKE